jgi:abhydrolase domain-containing protein 12
VSSVPKVYKNNVNLIHIAHKTVNVKIDSTDGISLGSWFTFPDPYFHAHGFDSLNISAALKSYPTVLYLHGNAVTRAWPSRVVVYSMFSSRLHVNVLAIDYRGFGDSTGTPTEEGTIQDALAAFDWLVSQGAKPDDVLVVGHSIGASVAAQATARLEQDRDIKIRGLVLFSGFTSIDKIIETYTLLGIPILAPMRYIPGGWGRLLFKLIGSI